MNDTDYMRIALDLAAKGMRTVSPNPMVGAVIVKEGEIIGTGWHRRAGETHAERNALADCSRSPEGSTMYVTLEPCCHYGKQPPCTDAIINAGIHRVVVGSSDPNPLVSGKGIDILRSSGIQVTENVLKDECDRLNEIFFHYITGGTPFVIMKYAMTMDGKIAAYTGLSQWITGEEARSHVQLQRHRCRGIMVGTGTVLADDPLLTCRLPGAESPLRIICDTSLRTPLSSRLVRTAGDVPTVIATCLDDERFHKPYEKAGCRILVLPSENGHIDLRRLIKVLGSEGIDSILLEGGGTLNWAALNSGIVNKVQAYIAPKLFGGRDAKTPVEGQGVLSPAEGFKLKNSTITKLGSDFLIESEVEEDVHRDS